MRITLSKEKLEELRALAAKRGDQKQKYASTQAWKKDYSHIHFYGIVGEWAAAQALGVEIDYRVGRHGDGGVYDLRLPNKQTVQVKTRAKPGYLYGLSSTDTCQFATDYGVLCWFVGTTFREVEVVGYITRDDFIKYCFKKDYGHGMRLWVDPKRFKPIEELMDIGYGISAKR